MELSVYKYKKEHPFIFKIIKKWIQAGFPVFRSLKHTIANDIHSEMIMRLMNAIKSNGCITSKEALKIHYKLGEEIGIQLKEVLSINKSNAKNISKIIDFIHGAMNVKSNKSLGFTNKISISIWPECPLHDQLKQGENSAQQYCNSQQEVYRGIISKINPNAKLKQIIRNESCAHCEIKTWIE